jgi:N-acetylglucosamine-6-phosphate deacetylase
MLAPQWRGAHPPGHLRAPSPVLYAGWSAQAGVALVTLAPELPGAVDAVAALVRRGVVVSLGHTGASADEVRAAADAGATSATHLFNAMAGLHHRDVGTAGAVLGEPRLRCGLIADGVHVHPDVVRLAWRLLGPERTVLVSDAVWALGAPPGRYHLGDTQVVADATSVRTADGTLAGSRLGLDAGLRTLLAVGVPAAEAIAAATSSPAALLGVTDRGHLRPGAVGDAVLLTPELEVAATVVRGRVVHRAG